MHGHRSGIYTVGESQTLCHTYHNNVWFTLELRRLWIWHRWKATNICHVACRVIMNSIWYSSRVFELWGSLWVVLEFFIRLVSWYVVYDGNVVGVLVSLTSTIIQTSLMTVAGIAATWRRVTSSETCRVLSRV